MAKLICLLVLAFAACMVAGLPHQDVNTMVHRTARAADPHPQYYGYNGGLHGGYHGGHHGGYNGGLHGGYNGGLHGGYPHGHGYNHHSYGHPHTESFNTVSRTVRHCIDGICHNDYE